jgi:imelysin
MIFIVVMGRDRLLTKQMASRATRTSFAGLPACLPLLVLACLLGCKSGGGSGGGGAGGNTGTAGTIGTGGDGNGAGGDGAVAFSRAELLGAFGTCAANQARDFRAKTVALDAAVSTYAATPAPATRDAARQAFKDALDSWQVLDPIQFGPTASGTVLGGKGFAATSTTGPASTAA